MTTLLDRVLAEAQAQFQRQGYVRWPEIAEQQGVSRQRVLQALQRGVDHGQVSAELVQKLRGSLAAARIVSFKCSEVNLEWLAKQAEALNCSVDDVINRIVVSHQQSTRLEVHHDNNDQTE